MMQPPPTREAAEIILRPHPQFPDYKYTCSLCANLFWMHVADVQAHILDWHYFKYPNTQSPTR